MTTGYSSAESPRYELNGRPSDANSPGGDARAADAYRLEPHVCRVCHTRLVSTVAGHGLRRFECPNCGAEAEGKDADVLCCCGMKVRRLNKGGASGHSLVSAGISCVKNPNPTPEFPSIYVAAET